MAASKLPPRTRKRPGQVTDILPTGQMIEQPSDDPSGLDAGRAGPPGERFPLSQAEHRARGDWAGASSHPSDEPVAAAPLDVASASPASKSTSRKVPPTAAKSAAPRRQAKAAQATSTATPPTAVTPAPSITLAQALELPFSRNAKEVLEAAGLRAFRRGGEPGATFGVVTLLQAFISVGMKKERGLATPARWLCNWVLDQSVQESALRTLAGEERRRTVGDATQIRLSPDAAAVLNRAGQLAAHLGIKPGARHLMIALLDFPQRPASEALRSEFRNATKLDLDRFRPSLIDRLVATRHPEPEASAWRKLHTAALPELHISQPDSATPPATSVVNLNADRASAGGSDPLGIAADVEAFARLICLEEATPPLSIGLFGEWGSGKSSFMERLQGSIEKLTHDTSREREAREKREAAVPPDPAGQAPEPPAAPRFVEDVVHIRFNAWHFADANLWASLTAEFFDQLRRGGHGGLRSSDYLALVGKVADRVRSLEANAQKADGLVAAAAAAAKQAEGALAESRKKLAASDLALVSAHLGKTLENFQKDNAASLKEVGTRIYRSDLSEDINGLKAAVAEASTIPGKITLVSRVIASGNASTLLAVGAVVLVAAGALGWQAGDPASTAVLLQRIIAWSTGAWAAWGAVQHALKSVKPVLDGAWEYAKEVESARKELTEEIASREAEVEKANEALAKAEMALNEAKAPLAQYGQGAATSAPGTILRYFLFEDGDVRDYDKHVGLVSRARRSFEQLDAIVAAGREGPAARQKKVRGEALTPKEAEALERFDAMKLADAQVTVPDRIVLYIDDLDRCTHEQVYAVLQAIHLLLAFELFVVVVGVDVRWVEEAVARQFSADHDPLRDNATPAEREAARLSRETARRKRAIDYLEKIFQLPFWLRRLQTDAAAGAKPGGTYAAYVRDLLGPNLEVPIDTPGVFATKAADGDEPITDSVSGDDSLGEATPEAAFADEAEFSAIDQALATVRLTPAEVDFLASREIGDIAAKSPRAVKRLLNVYRIIRARMSGPELAAFLGEGGEPPTWPIAVFLAAVECGQPVEVADALYDALKRMDARELFDTESFKAILEMGNSGAGGMAEANGMFADTLSPGIHALNARRGSPERGPNSAKAGQALAMARIVRRYSFNRYH